MKFKTWQTNRLKWPAWLRKIQFCIKTIHRDWHRDRVCLMYEVMRLYSKYNFLPLLRGWGRQKYSFHSPRVNTAALAACSPKKILYLAQWRYTTYGSFCLTNYVLKSVIKLGVFVCAFLEQSGTTYSPSQRLQFLKLFTDDVFLPATV